MIYGYARVSTRTQETSGTSLESQKEQLKAAGAERIFSDCYTGTKMDRPEFEKLLNEVVPGDTIIVCKMDRFARSISQASELITELIDKGVTINVLNLGVLDNSSMSVLLRNMLLAFGQFERDMIVERTQEGRKKSGNLGGRPHKYSKPKLDHAIELLEQYSYNQVSEMTGISKSTLLREKQRRNQSSP